MPFVFAGSSAASAGAARAIVAPVCTAGPARRLAIVGTALELTAASVMEGRLGFLAEPYTRGRAGALATAAKGLTVAGALTMLLQGRRRSGAVVAGALLLAGSVAERFAIFRAGLDSARDPRYTVVPQRQLVDQRASDARVMPQADALRAALGLTPARPRRLGTARRSRRRACACRLRACSSR